MFITIQATTRRQPHDTRALVTFPSPPHTIAQKKKKRTGVGGVWFQAAITIELIESRSTESRSNECDRERVPDRVPDRFRRCTAGGRRAAVAARRSATTARSSLVVSTGADISSTETNGGDELLLPLQVRIKGGGRGLRGKKILRPSTRKEGHKFPIKKLRGANDCHPRSSAHRQPPSTYEVEATARPGPPPFRREWVRRFRDPLARRRAAATAPSIEAVLCEADRVTPLLGELEKKSPTAGRSGTSIMTSDDMPYFRRGSGGKSVGVNHKNVDGERRGAWSTTSLPPTTGVATLLPPTARARAHTHTQTCTRVKRSGDKPQRRRQDRRRIRSWRRRQSRGPTGRRAPGKPPRSTASATATETPTWSRG